MEKMLVPCGLTLLILTVNTALLFSFQGWKVAIIISVLFVMLCLDFGTDEFVAESELL